MDFDDGQTSLDCEPRSPLDHDPVTVSPPLACFSISPLTQYWVDDIPLKLELGGELEQIKLAYRTWGRLSPEGDNAVIVCHALTGSADADDWWSPLFGAGGALDPACDFIICSNALGGCYGSTGPTSLDASGHRYGSRFPALTTRDQVRAQMRLADALGVRSIQCVLGGSMGGFFALEWAALDPLRVCSIVVIASSARHSAWCMSWSETQRMALRADPRFLGGDYPPDAPPATGLGAARAIAMSTYRSPGNLHQRHGHHGAGAGIERDGRAHSIRTWLNHHARSFVERFDANCYLTLIDAMDRHDIGSDRGGMEVALRAIAQPALVVAISTDVLYVPAEQRDMATILPNSKFIQIESPHGHDGFLIDAALLEPHIAHFRKQLSTSLRYESQSCCPLSPTIAVDAALRTES